MSHVTYECLMSCMNATCLNEDVLDLGNSLQHTTPHCNTMQHTATHFSQLQKDVLDQGCELPWRRHLGICYNKLQHTATR